MAEDFRKTIWPEFEEALQHFRTKLEELGAQVDHIGANVWEAGGGVDYLNLVVDTLAGAGAAASVEIGKSTAKSIVRRIRSRSHFQFTEQQLIENAQRAVAARVSLAYDELACTAVGMNLESGDIDLEFETSVGERYILKARVINDNISIKTLRHEAAGE